MRNSFETIFCTSTLLGYGPMEEPAEIAAYIAAVLSHSETTVSKSDLITLPSRMFDFLRPFETVTLKNYNANTNDYRKCLHLISRKGGRC